MDKVYTLVYGVYYQGSWDYGSDLGRVFGTVEKAQEAAILHCFDVAASEAGNPNDHQYLAIGEVDRFKHHEPRSVSVLRGVVVYTTEYDPEDFDTHLSPLTFVYWIIEAEVE